MADIRHSIQIATKEEQIYPLVATAKGFGGWWATDITEATGVVELGFFNRATIYRLRHTIEQPPVSAEWVYESGDEWSGTRISFQMEAAKSGTLLHFSHAGWRVQSEYFTSCNTTWGELMFRLKAAAEGKVTRPFVHPRGMGCLNGRLSGRRAGPLR
jgi:hypothetical protein